MVTITTVCKLGVPQSNIGLIAPYNLHKELLKEMCPFGGVEINTVDQYQGKDKSIIIMSFVRHGNAPRSTQDHKHHQKVNYPIANCDRYYPPPFIHPSQQTSSIDILNDERRVNVALTRAKHKLIMIGNLDYLSDTYKPIDDIRKVLTATQVVQIEQRE